MTDKEMQSKQLAIIDKGNSRANTKRQRKEKGITSLAVTKQTVSHAASVLLPGVGRLIAIEVEITICIIT